MRKRALFVWKYLANVYGSKTCHLPKNDDELTSLAANNKLFMTYGFLLENNIF